jgi:hypothetical protein
MTGRGKYEAFCRSVPDLPVFAQPWFLDSSIEEGHWDAVVAEENGQPVAALPFCFRQRWWGRYTFMPALVKYLGPLLAPAYRGLKYEHRYYKSLIAGLPPIARTEMAFHPGVTNWLPFYWQDFRQTTRYTYRLHLEDWLAVESGLNRNIRRNLVKADRHLHLLEEGKREDFYRLLQSSFNRQSLVFPLSADFLYRHLSALDGHKAGRLFYAADASGRVHSVACLIWDKSAAYYHLSGDDAQLRQSGSGIWLAWQAIRYTREVLGLPVFDFEGSMIPEIEAIRRQFGSLQTPYFFVSRSRYRLFDLLAIAKG